MKLATYRIPIAVGRESLDQTHLSIVYPLDGSPFGQGQGDDQQMIARLNRFSIR